MCNSRSLWAFLHSPARPHFVVLHNVELARGIGLLYFCFYCEFLLCFFLLCFQVPDNTTNDCAALGYDKCRKINGAKGLKGKRGGDGGKAGLPGKMDLILWILDSSFG